MSTLKELAAHIGEVVVNKCLSAAAKSGMFVSLRTSAKLWQRSVRLLLSQKSPNSPFSTSPKSDRDKTNVHGFNLNEASRAMNSDRTVITAKPTFGDRLSNKSNTVPSPSTSRQLNQGGGGGGCYCNRSIIFKASWAAVGLRSCSCSQGDWEKGVLGIVVMAGIKKGSE
jgi:hypothetical protein